MEIVNVVFEVVFKIPQHLISKFVHRMVLLTASKTDHHPSKSKR